jgi:hypothetical protein
MATCKDCRGILTASNEAQLATRNRAELRKWNRLFRGRAFFSQTATALISADPAHEQTWRVDLLPWNEHRPESFAGLHNQGRRIVVIMDEASVIPPIIWQTLEPTMTDVSTEIIWCVFGNPLHNSGPFRECFGRFAHRWQRWHIDSRDVGISDKQQIAQWAEDHAEDSYFFTTRVRGLFPTAGALQFIASDLVEAAMVREVVPLPNDPLIVGVDIARFGDDSSVIYARRGMDARSILPIEVRGASTDRLEDLILKFCLENRVDVIFIDGTGVGGGVDQRDQPSQVRADALHDVGQHARRNAVLGAAKEYGAARPAHRPAVRFQSEGRATARKEVRYEEARAGVRPIWGMRSR